MSLKEGCKIVLNDCLDIKEEENVLIVTDDSKLEIGKALYEEANKICKEALILVMKPREVNGQEPPAVVAKAMELADVVICPTKTSLTHTNARINAVNNGARVATMPGITVDMFSEGAITANYSEIENLTFKITNLLSNSQNAKIVKDRRVLTMSLKGRKGIASTGIYKKPGTSGNLPSGEAYIAPVEETAEGEMIIDGSMVGVGKVTEPLHVKIKAGKVAEIKGKDAVQLSILLENEKNASLCELGIGTNMKAKITGNILEDEKAYGTIHIAFGTNTSFGGTIKADCHMDGVILGADLYLDDVLILSKGKFLI